MTWAKIGAAREAAEAEELLGWLAPVPVVCRFEGMQDNPGRWVAHAARALDQPGFTAHVKPSKGLV